jgi:hypothetical protein
MVGPRVFEPHEVDDLVPSLEGIFGELEGLKRKLRTLQLRVNTLELIWGEAVHQAGHRDHRELEHHLAEMKATQEAFERQTAKIADLGGELKGIDPPLVDFLGVREGRLVSLCWTRGEERITHWHHVDEGFAARQPL